MELPCRQVARRNWQVDSYVTPSAPHSSWRSSRDAGQCMTQCTQCGRPFWSCTQCLWRWHCTSSQLPAKAKQKSEFVMDFSEPKRLTERAASTQGSFFCSSNFRVCAALCSSLSQFDLLVFCAASQGPAWRWIWKRLFHDRKSTSKPAHIYKPYWCGLSVELSKKLQFTAPKQFLVFFGAYCFTCVFFRLGCIDWVWCGQSQRATSLSSVYQKLSGIWKLILSGKWTSSN